MVVSVTVGRTVFALWSSFRTVTCPRRGGFLLPCQGSLRLIRPCPPIPILPRFAFGRRCDFGIGLRQRVEVATMGHSMSQTWQKGRVKMRMASSLNKSSWCASAEVSVASRGCRWRVNGEAVGRRNGGGRHVLCKTKAPGEGTGRRKVGRRAKGRTRIMFTQPPIGNAGSVWGKRPGRVAIIGNGLGLGGAYGEGPLGKRKRAPASTGARSFEIPCVTRRRRVWHGSGCGGVGGPSRCRGRRGSRRRSCGSAG